MQTLKQAREAKGVTKIAMARHLGISSKTYYTVSYTHLTLPTKLEV